MDVNYNQNRSLTSASGDLIFSLSADDQVVDEFIKFMGEEIDISKNIGVYYCAPLIVDKVHNTFNILQPFGDFGRVYEALGLSQSFSKADKRKYGHLSLLKSKLASEHGLYEEDVVLFSDWFIAYQIALIHETTFLNQGFRIYIFYINSYSLDEIKSINDSYELAKYLTREDPNVAELFFRSGLHTGSGLREIFIFSMQLILLKYFLSLSSFRILIRKVFHNLLKVFKKKELIFESAQK